MADLLQDKSTSSLISIVVPCFNEQEVLRLTHRRLIDTLGSHRDFAIEIVYVDDGSSDSTSAILDELAGYDSRVVIIPLTRNFGQQAAVTAGLQYASGDAVVVIDADLQDPPEVILAMIEKWKGGDEIVYGVRAKRAEGLFKRIGYFTFYRLLKFLAHVDIPVDSGDFALLDRISVDAINALPERSRFVRGLRTWVGFKQTGIAYERSSRAAGQSKYSFVKLVTLAFNGLFSFSAKPLSYILVLGVASSLFSAIGIVVFLVWRVSGVEIFGQSPKDVPGFTSIVLLLFLLSGIQLISIGIIGEYIGRIYDETKNRPTFIARQPRRLKK
jgi:glycosyltransferase involved in cell wall biosynthesis